MLNPHTCTCIIPTPSNYDNYQIINITDHFISVTLLLLILRQCEDSSITMSAKDTCFCLKIQPLAPSGHFYYILFTFYMYYSV